MKRLIFPLKKIFHPVRSNLLVLVFILISGCSGLKKSGVGSFQEIYKFENNAIIPSVGIFQVGENTAQIYFKINSDDLLFSRKTINSPFETSLNIRYETYNSVLLKNIKDSASFFFNYINNDNNNNFIYGKFEIPATIGENLVVKAIFSDLKYNVPFYQLILRDSAYFNLSNYKLVSASTKLPVFHNSLKAGEKFEAHFNSFTQPKSISVYKRIFDFPPPPFSVYDPIAFDLTPDNLIALDNLSDTTFQFTCPADGILSINCEGDQNGPAYVVRDAAFPAISSLENMIPPLRYLCSNKEFENILNSPNAKMDFDKFWLSCAGSKERARQLIAAYYNRVEEANFFFSTHLEGWKTDRGLIHVIFGQPNNIYKNFNTEIWIYGEENNSNSFVFRFTKKTNPFSENDFRLHRDPIFKPIWYKNVEAWRNGRILNL